MEMGPVFETSYDNSIFTWLIAQEAFIAFFSVLCTNRIKWRVRPLKCDIYYTGCYEIWYEVYIRISRLNLISMCADRLLNTNPRPNFHCIRLSTFFVTETNSEIIKIFSRAENVVLIRVFMLIILIVPDSRGVCTITGDLGCITALEAQIILQILLILHLIFCSYFKSFEFFLNIKIHVPLCSLVIASYSST
jgi:hypothetical protein